MGSTWASARARVTASKRVFQLHQPRGKAEGGRVLAGGGASSLHAKGWPDRAGESTHEPRSVAPLGPGLSVTASSRCTPVAMRRLHCVAGRSASTAVQRS
jgi:hypothetical protein